MTRETKDTIITAAIAVATVAVIVWPSPLRTVGITIVVILWLVILWLKAWVSSDDDKEGGEG